MDLDDSSRTAGGAVEGTRVPRPPFKVAVATRWVARGTYRFTTFPPIDREREVVVLLWAGADAAVPVTYSHETALRHYDPTDAFAETLHLSCLASVRTNSDDRSIGRAFEESVGVQQPSRPRSRQYPAASDVVAYLPLPRRPGTCFVGASAHGAHLG